MRNFKGRGDKGKGPQKNVKRDRPPPTALRFPERATKDWRGPLVVYREIELLRKCMTSSSKVMSRKRAGTSSQEQSAIKAAIHQARFMGLLPYAGT